MCLRVKFLTANMKRKYGDCFRKVVSLLKALQITCTNENLRMMFYVNH